MTTTEHVENAAALTRVFGDWPSFNDAEVVSIRLDGVGEGGPSLEAWVHVFRTTDQVDEQGYYVLTDHTLVALRFANTVLRKLHWINGRNSLSRLDIQEVDPATSDGRRYGVSFDSSWGIRADILCDRITVTAVEPVTPSV
jgi:hypothetical protein